jgi:hypothetical protein
LCNTMTKPTKQIANTTTSTTSTMTDIVTHQLVFY